MSDEIALKVEQERTARSKMECESREKLTTLITAVGEGGLALVNKMVDQGHERKLRLLEIIAKAPPGEGANLAKILVAAL